MSTIHILPASVRVGPYTYRFLRTDEADSDGGWALISYMRRIIGFGILCNREEMPRSLIHELVHAVANAYGVKLEEEQVSALANGLAQALTDLKLLPETMRLKGERGDG